MKMRERKRGRFTHVNVLNLARILTCKIQETDCTNFVSLTHLLRVFFRALRDAAFALKVRAREIHEHVLTGQPYVREEPPSSFGSSNGAFSSSTKFGFRFPPGVREQQLHHQHQRGGFFFGHSSPHRVRVLINGKHKFVASTDGCVSVADFVSKKLKDIEVLRGKEVKVTLGDDFELIGSSPISILGQDECVRVKTIDRKGKEEERFYSDASGESEEEEEEEEEEETFASEEEEDWMKPRRRSDKKNGVGVSRRKKMCGRVCVNGKICKRIAGECPWHSKGKVRKERVSKDRDEEDNIICAICDKGTYPAKLVLCDSCDQGYHTFCYGLEKVPKGECVCASCAIKRKKVPPRSPAVQAKNPRNEHNEKKKKKKKVSSYANLLTYRTETTHSPTTSKSGVAKKKKKAYSTVSMEKRCDEALQRTREYIESLGGTLSGEWKCSCTMYRYQQAPSFLYFSPNGATFRSRKAVARFLGFDVV